MGTYGAKPLAAKGFGLCMAQGMQQGIPQLRSCGQDCLFERPAAVVRLMSVSFVGVIQSYCYCLLGFATGFLS